MGNNSQTTITMCNGDKFVVVGTFEEVRQLIELHKQLVIVLMIAFVPYGGEIQKEERHEEIGIFKDKIQYFA